MAQEILNSEKIFHQNFHSQEYDLKESENFQEFNMLLLYSLLYSRIKFLLRNLQYLSVSYPFSPVYEKFSFPGVNDQYHVHPPRMGFNRSVFTVWSEKLISLFYSKINFYDFYTFYIVFFYSRSSLCSHYFLFCYYEFTNDVTILISFFFFLIKQATKLSQQRF